jgi:flavin reductase (DIM6/NTAB) family NADH-FMN oxidoreductase RutF
MTLEPEALRRAMRTWTTGVTIVTARAGEERHGMTVSAFTSISLDPPLVLVSLANTTRTGNLVRQSGYFGVTVLAAGQRHISEVFAGKVDDGGDRFAGVETGTLESGVDLIEGGLAWLDCRVVEVIAVGKNHLYLGEVIAVRSAEGGEPLVYFDRNYQELCD